MKFSFSKKLLALLITGTISLTTASIVNGKIIKKEAIEQDDNYSKKNKKDKLTGEKKLVEEKSLEEKLNDLQVEQKPIIRANERIKVRMEPDYYSDRLGLLGVDQELPLIERTNDEWYKVYYKDMEGYVSAEYVIEDVKFSVNDKIKKVGYFIDESILYGDLNQTNQIINIPQYASANIYDEDDTHYLIESEGKIGFINKENVEILTDTFVVVDITDQELKMYENDELLLDTPVITGLDNTKQETPIGLYNIGYGSNDFTGPRWLRNEDGSRKVWVDTMMHFNGEIGLHDAERHTCDHGYHGWKNTEDFNPYTYLTNGSNGCVNMLNDAAMTAYNTLEPGDKVLVKK